MYALERGFDLLVLDGTGALGGEWPELRAAPDLALVHDTIATLRRLKKEEMIAPLRGCRRSCCPESALADCCRGSAEGITQPFACLVD